LLELAIVAACGLGLLLLGFWLTRPLAFVWRWLGRCLFAGILITLLAPAGAIDPLQDWVRDWLPLSSAMASGMGADKLSHFLSFVALAALLFRFRRDVAATWIAVGLAALGGVTEILQLLVDGRSASWGDWFADCLGIGLGFAIVLSPAQGGPEADE
jgi:uncharacterized protein YfiM (DUF2279 family)